MVNVKEVKQSLLHLFFPHICSGCGSDLLTERSALCARCIHSMPDTGFERFAGNPVEKRFWGRLPLAAATAQFYFTRESMMQQLIHQFKYRGNKDLCRQLGRMMGDQLKRSGRFIPDVLVPLPLFASRQKKRGYNQALVLCEGIAEKLLIPVEERAIIRSHHTDTQTRKGRIERWQNMEGKFILAEPRLVRDRHLLLIDDVITTGATLEACGHALLESPGTVLSIATLCYASK